MKALTAEEITALLKELDSFPGGSAEALAILGIKGLPLSSVHCPVYKYLSMHGRVGFVSTNFTSTCNNGCAGTAVSNPEQVRKFIIELDTSARDSVELEK